MLVWQYYIVYWLVKGLSAQYHMKQCIGLTERLWIESDGLTLAWYCENRHMVVVWIITVCIWNEGVVCTVCKLNVHKRCAKNVANNCGINTKDMAKVLQELGISGDKFSTASKRKKVRCHYCYALPYRWDIKSCLLSVCLSLFICYVGLYRAAVTYCHTLEILLLNGLGKCHKTNNKR